MRRGDVVPGDPFVCPFIFFSAVGVMCQAEVRILNGICSPISRDSDSRVVDRKEKGFSSQKRAAKLTTSQKGNHSHINTSPTTKKEERKGYAPQQHRDMPLFIHYTNLLLLNNTMLPL